MDNDKNPKLNVLPQVVIDHAMNMMSHANRNVRSSSRDMLSIIAQRCEYALNSGRKLDETSKGTLLDTKKFCEDVLHNRYEVAEREAKNENEYYYFGNRYLKRR